jgi:hypothetical protein
MSVESSEREFAAWAESLHAEYDAFLRQSWAASGGRRGGARMVARRPAGRGFTWRSTVSWRRW